MRWVFCAGVVDADVEVESGWHLRLPSILIQRLSQRTNFADRRYLTVWLEQDDNQRKRPSPQREGEGQLAFLEM